MSAAAITGLGVVAANGWGVKEFWAATLAGRTGIVELDRFDTGGLPARLAGLVRDVDPAQHLPSRLLPQTDVSTRLALVAAQHALDDADVDTTAMTDYDMGVVTANACGGFAFTHREFNKLWSKGSQHVSVYESFAWFYAVNTGQITIRHGMRGPSCALVAEQAGGLGLRVAGEHYDAAAADFDGVGSVRTWLKTLNSRLAQRQQGARNHTLHAG
jgi:act minimal PKS chain-length factor (CLF/KS beta)